MGIRQRVSDGVLSDAKATQSTFVYYCLLVDGLVREYESLEHQTHRLLDRLNIPAGSISERLELAHMSGSHMNGKGEHTS